VSWQIWAEVLPAFRVLDKVELWTTVREVVENVTDPDGNSSVSIVKQPVPTTLTHLILALAIFQIALLAGRNLPGLLEIAVLNRLPIDRGGRYAVSVICRYALTVTGFIFGFRMLGLTWSSVQWLIAAMTVGLGFGLQEIFANFVSGMIILFERPMRVGDLVTIGGMTGTVARVQIRATTITDADRRELIVPNKNFITGELINWTLSDTISRIVIPIGVAYGTNIELTQRTLLQVAEAHPAVISEPAATAMFVNFGGSTLNFELRVFLGSRESYAQVLHELNSNIDRRFREAGIEIALPRQELTLKSAAPILPFLQEPSPPVERVEASEKKRAA
jgi:potassium efflux system protein